MMEDTRELVCIVCPIGCRMTVSGLSGDGADIRIEGNTCARGADYAVREAKAPARTVPSTVLIRGAFLPRLPVKTARPVPKESIMQCMEAIRNVVVKAPIRIGDVIVDNLAGTGVNLVATRSMGASD